MKSLNMAFQLSPLPSSVSLIVSAWKGKQLEFLNRHFINPSILIKRVLVLLLKLGFLHTILHKVPLLKQRRGILQCSSYFIIHGCMLASSKKMPTLTCQVSSQYEGFPSYKSTLVEHVWFWFLCLFSPQVTHTERHLLGFETQQLNVSYQGPNEKHPLQLVC